MKVFDEQHAGFAGSMARRFVDSKLTPLIVLTAIFLGFAATVKLPREEEPQIKVPMIDVMVAMPGTSAAEIQQRVTRPMEKLLWEIPEVEYLYSTSGPGESMVTVRYKVGTDIEAALVRLNQKLETNFDRIPEGVSMPLVKPRTIDDVPVLALTFHGGGYGPYELRRLVSQVEEYVKQIPEVAETNIIGGARRQVRVLVDPIRMEARDISYQQIAGALAGGNREAPLGEITSGNAAILIGAGEFFREADDVGDQVVGVFDGKPVFLRDVARIVDGPEEARDYVFTTAEGVIDVLEPAVTLSFAKRPGANAISVVHAVMERIESLRGQIIPSDVSVTVTRDYGETAREKSDELLLHMGIAVVSVALLIMFFLGWREALVVLLAIPATLGLTLLVFYLYGYTLNRITLFALIFSIGILVDDAIVVVENIARHVHLPGAQSRSLRQIAIAAVAEVGNPTVLATWAVIAAILPMAFVGGLMGPYMRPIPVGASAAMIFSLLVAFIVTPWAAIRVIFWRRSRESVAAAHAHTSESWMTRVYRWTMHHLLTSALWRWGFLGGVVVLLLGCMALVGIGWVGVKMLPFDNKSEFQVILNMPEGTALEDTLRVAKELGEAVREVPEVRDYQIYAGTAAPFNFNGLVRHYFLRRGSNVADIQVNLLPKHARDRQSHDIAVGLRPALAAIAERNGGRIAVAEVPPGPPVLQTIVAEVYGPDAAQRERLAARVMEILESAEGVVDVDWYVEAPQEEVRFVVDKQKAAFHGIHTGDITQMIHLAAEGMQATLLHDPDEREDVVVRMELPLAYRGSPDDFLNLRIAGSEGIRVPLRELVRMERSARPSNLYHKNLMPVTYVTADVAGAVESPVYAILAMNRELAKIDPREFGGSAERIKVYNFNHPDQPLEPAIKWDGEWHITIEVFRDLGIAFGVVLILIYMLMVGWFRSFMVPIIVMAAIPFSLIGILPAHGAMGAFFTATSMIGFMAGAGIVVRNSIILVDFIEMRLREGDSLEHAVEEAGAVRFRPMLLTALAVVVAAAVILADPIFQGLAISLMAGEVASLLISRTAVPVLYFMYRKRIPLDDAAAASQA